MSNRWNMNGFRNRGRRENLNGFCIGTHESPAGVIVIGINLCHWFLVLIDRFHVGRDHIWIAAVNARCIQENVITKVCLGDCVGALWQVVTHLLVPRAVGGQRGDDCVRFLYLRMIKTPSKSSSPASSLFLSLLT